MKTGVAGWLALAMLGAVACSGDGGSGETAPDTAEDTTTGEHDASPDGTNAPDGTDAGPDRSDWCQGPVDCAAPTPFCDPGTGDCVGCLFDLHCESNERCVDTTCRPESVCDEPGVDCEAAAAPPCEDDCFPCEADSWCPGIYHCEDGRCVLDRCHQDEGTCTDDGLIACNERGDGWIEATPCPDKHTCVQDGWAGSCEEWKCEPGGTCQGEDLIVCREDGLEVLESVDCEDEGALCKHGECVPIVCEAGEDFCDEEALGRKFACSDDGTEIVDKGPCQPLTFCLSGQCVPQACQPGEPTCNFDSVATCDEFGSGPVDEGTPCGEDEVCVKGACEEVVCEPNSFFCTDDQKALAECNPTGTDFTATACPTGTTCRDNENLPDGPGCSG
ncbi:MAG: hypothetical protein ACQEXJ_19300 [Myxococcota bacterium]